MKVKKWLLGLVTFAAMAVLCAVCAGAETYGDYEYDVLDNGTVEITGYNGSAEKVDIPAEIDGKSVTSIGNYAFSGNSSFTNVTIPNGVTNIGIGAFDNCRKLISISIPNCVTSIGDYAFSSCYGLTRITIPESVKIISEFVFSDCRNLTNIRIPGSVTSICKGAFRGCTSLTSITIPNGVTSIGGSAFDGCTSLTSITIPNSVTRILGDTFRDCSNLTSVTLPESLTYIGSAFGGCTSLTSITIPNSVTYVDAYAFAGCTSLTEIKVAVENPNYVSVNGVLYNKSRTVLICYPAGKKDKNYKILDSVTAINRYAFYGCTSLASIMIPDSVTEICESAFSGCTSLTSITIPDSVMSIARFTFYYCANLKSIKIPNSVTNIGESAFGGCTSLTSITIPNSVTDIDTNTFSGCTSLTSITIPNSVTEIGWWAFYGCTSLTSITIPNSVTNIGESAFRGCTSLTSITIPNSVTSIGKKAFGYYYDEYDDSVKKIDNFKIYCYSGTAGEKYAKDNGFDYELITAEKPANVTGFKVKSLTSTNVTLQWNKNSSASGYEIEQYKGGKWTNVAKIKGNATTSYTVKGLAAGTAGYQFRIRAYRTEGKNKAYSGYSATVKVNTNPYGVGGFKCSSKTSTSVTLKWNKGTTASGYQLQQYKDGKWVTIYTGTKATNTSYTVKKLKAGTAGYRFRIRAYKTYGNTKQYGSWSSEVKVNTNPYGVGGFKCSSKTSTSVTLKWNKGTTASGYQLQQYKDGKWVTIYTGTKATNTSFTVKKLKAGTAGYRFRIRAYKTYGNTKQYGSWSSEVKVNTNPYGVGGFKCSSKTSTSVTLKWNKGTTASGYQLQQYKDGKWVTIYTGTKATNTSYTVKNLKAGTAGYRFRIRAYKTYGNTKQYGSWSSEVKVNTNPYGVGGFKAKSTAKNSITLGWNKGTTASGYQLQQYKGGKWVTVYTGTKATSTSCTIKSLKANTSYKFRIRAYKTYGNAKQYGSWSSTLTVKTKK